MLKIPYNIADGKYDPIGVGMIEKLFELVGLNVVLYPEGRYGVDMAVMINDQRIFDVDAEVRPNWTGGKFPFDPVHIVPRKMAKTFKFPVFFASIDATGTKAMLISKDDVVPVEPMKNRRSQGQAEAFHGYYLDEHKYFYFDLKDIDLCKESLSVLLKHPALKDLLVTNA